jgi:hypothetical protein
MLIYSQKRIIKYAGFVLPTEKKTLKIYALFLDLIWKCDSVVLKTVPERLEPRPELRGQDRQGSARPLSALKKARVETG